MDTLTNKRGSEDRLPILVSAEGGVKLFHVPALPHKSTELVGPQIGRAAMKAYA